MIDPVIFTVNLGNLTFSLYWYGLLVMLGVAVAAWMTARGVKRRGQDPDYVWDSLLYVLPAGVVGARLWYVANVTLGGNLRFIQEPSSIVNLRQGGLHYYGAILFGAIAFYIYAKKMGFDMWLALDAVSPSLLIGQAIARPGNFINQELYGQPTGLPWGIPIEAQNRIPPWNDLGRFPAESTRFHPTFAYEILWNVFAAGLILYVTKRFEDKLKPGAAFGAWLILAGVGRNIIEFFRPDQPVIPGTGFSYSRLVAILMILGGVLLILIKYERVKFSCLNAGRDSYVIIPPLEDRLAEGKGTAENVVGQDIFKDQDEAG
jgi:phosphatidylglycerol---prolipoprotein diacylglyceryl transferase